MKIQQHARTESNLSSEAESADFQIAADGIGKVMAILSGIYSDKYLAVIREYASNALDSHRAAGKGDIPVRVTSPNADSPELVIQDFGLGLSKEEIFGIWRTFGETSKAMSSKMIGGFGIGSKTAFSITPQFTMISVKDGIRIAALLSMGDSGIPRVTIIDESPTGEQNGVRIAIPVSDADDMRRAIRENFLVWEPGSVLVDGEEPELLWPSLDTIQDGQYRHNGRSLSAEKSQAVLDWAERIGRKFSVLVGNSLYPVSSSIISRAIASVNDDDAREYLRWFGSSTDSSGDRFIARVPIGGVHLAPSREAVQDSEHTVRGIASALLTLARNFINDANRDIGGAPTLAAASKAADRYRPAFPKRIADEFSWQGIKFAGVVKTDLSNAALGKGGRLTWSRDGFAAEFGKTNLSKVMFVTGMRDDFTRDSAARRLYSRYLNLADDGITQIVEVPADSEGHFGWLSFGPGGDATSVSVEEFVAEARQLPTLASRRQSTTQPILYEGMKLVEYRYNSSGIGVATADSKTEYTVDELNELGDSVAYYEATSAYSTNHLKANLGHWDEFISETGTTPVFVPVSRKATALLKRVPEARPLVERYEQWCIKKAGQVTAEEVLRASFGRYRMLDALSPLAGKIESPEMRALIERYQAAMNSEHLSDERRAFVEKVASDRIEAAREEMKKLVVSVWQQFPLLPHPSQIADGETHRVWHAVLYINAVVNAA